MKFTEFSTLLDGDVASLAMFSTFQFDPEYFERQLLHRCSCLHKARRIVVFMDSGEWRALIQQNINVRLLNRRYLVVPVRLFHWSLPSKIISDTDGEWWSCSLW